MWCVYNCHLTQEADGMDAKINILEATIKTLQTGEAKGAENKEVC